MLTVQNRSASNPATTEALQLTLEVLHRAEAMGLLRIRGPRDDASALRQLATALRAAGIATSAVEILTRGPAPTGTELSWLLRSILTALEASPAPSHEWKAVMRVFPAEDLGTLLDVSPSSLKRYQSGERDTPDPVAARLHFLALVIGDLAGTYNDTGIRRWFQRRRTQLDDRAPAALLASGWDPDDDGPQRVRALARSLVTMSGT